MQAVAVADRLAMEYVRVKATPDMTPSDILRLYEEAYTEIFSKITASK